MKKQSAERDDGSNSMDRISQLPEAILQHILYFLSQKEAAQTCVLSKAWLYLWSTRPNFEFREKCFNGTKQRFLSLLNKTLQGYHDRKLFIQEFLIGMSTADSESVSLLEKWIPIVILNMGVQTFSLYFDSTSWAYFDLPSVVFEAESLQDLYLKRCKFNQKAPDKVLFNHLKTLSLTYVYIAEKTFQKIISSCPLIEFVALHGCEGLRTIKVNKLHNLKNFDFSNYEKYREEDSSIEFDVPTLETIRIVGSANWFHHHNYFPRLKSLYLSRVRLSNNSFDNLSCDFPSLEELTLLYCYGFEEFQLLSHSIKYFSFAGRENSIKAAIDAPNIVKFEFSGDFLPSISFTTTSSEWKSNIFLGFLVDLDDDASSWFLKLNELLKALSQSEISLGISQLRRNQHIEDPLVLDTDGGFYKPVVVENLSLSSHTSSSFSAFLDGLFRICRPRNIGQYWYANAHSEWEREHKQVTEYLCKILLMDRESRNNQELRQYFWQQDVEEVSMEAFDKNGEEWHPVDGTTLLECALPKNQYKQDIRFRLKWREKL